MRVLPTLWFLCGAISCVVSKTTTNSDDPGVTIASKLIGLLGQASLYTSTTSNLPPPPPSAPASSPPTGTDLNAPTAVTWQVPATTTVPTTITSADTNPPTSSGPSATNTSPQDPDGARDGNPQNVHPQNHVLTATITLFTKVR